MKKILLSVSMVAFVVALTIGATGAFFSDTETSTGNTFTAGAIDLQIDSTQHYNGNTCTEVGTGVFQWQGNSAYPVVGSTCGGTWALKDLVPTADKFFNFADVKPGDSGEDTVSLHVINNDAWLCASVANLANNDNGLTEPESAVDSTDGVGNGELQNSLTWTVWRDDGSGGGVAGDNIQNGTEPTLASGAPTNGTLAVYDSTTATGALAAGSTGYLGVAWSLPSATGNEVQTDSLTGDISFYTVQSRNNASFTCASLNN